MLRNAVSTLAVLATLALAACSSGNNLAVRHGPQAELPYTPGPNNGQPQSLDALQTHIGSIPAGENAYGVAPSDITNILAPGTGTQTNFTPAITLFKGTCLSHSTNPSAIANIARAHGLDVEQPNANQLFAMGNSNGMLTSVQVNIASQFTNECAVSAAGSPNVSVSEVRTLFFRSLGLSHSNGVATTRIGGQSYTLRHQMLDGGAFGFNEHIFLMHQS